MCLAANFISARFTIINDQSYALKFNEGQKIIEKRNMVQKKLTPEQIDRLKFADYCIKVVATLIFFFAMISFVFPIMLIPTLILGILLAIMDPFITMVDDKLKDYRHYI